MLSRSLWVAEMAPDPPPFLYAPRHFQLVLIRRRHPQLNEPASWGPQDPCGPHVSPGYLTSQREILPLTKKCLRYENTGSKRT